MDSVEKLNYRQQKSARWPHVSRKIINEQVQVVGMCFWRVMSTKVINREYFMESAGVRYLHTSCWRIRNRTSERSERVRFLIQKQRVGKYRTKHFTCGIVFIIYVVVQFSYWFEFYCPLFWGMVMYDNQFETKEIKIQTKDKIEPQHIRTVTFIILVAFLF